MAIGSMASNGIWIDYSRQQLVVDMARHHNKCYTHFKKPLPTLCSVAYCHLMGDKAIIAGWRHAQSPTSCWSVMRNWLCRSSSVFGSDHKLCCLPKPHLIIFIMIWISCSICSLCSHLSSLNSPQKAFLLLVNHLCVAQTRARCLCESFTLSNTLLAHSSICSVEYNTKGTYSSPNLGDFRVITHKLSRVG